MVRLFTACLRHAFFVLLISIPTACSEKKTFENFNSSSWKGDKLACKGDRQQLAGEFEKIRRELLGMSQEDIIDLLGRPDFQLLLERTQKAYVYFVEPGTQCQGQHQTSKARTVSFRFNAMNRATEVLYGEGKPL